MEDTRGKKKLKNGVNGKSPDLKTAFSKANRLAEEKLRILQGTNPQSNLLYN